MSQVRNHGARPSFQANRNPIEEQMGGGGPLMTVETEVATVGLLKIYFIFVYLF